MWELVILDSLAKRKERVNRIIKILREKTRLMVQPMGFFIARKYHNDPFLILISCLLSLRSKDVVTLPVSEALFRYARTPQELVDIPRSKLELIIKPIGFYRRKAEILHNVSQELIDRFDGKVPDTEEELLSLKGVGRKTANLVLGVAFGVPSICVDTHVHRLANQIGLVSTRTPEQTEEELKKIVPEKDWIELNKLLVMWGQQIPRSQQVSELLKALKNYKSTT